VLETVALRTAAAAPGHREPRRDPWRSGPCSQVVRWQRSGHRSL